MEFSKRLDESLALVSRLLILMEEDLGDMQKCINGDVLDVYSEAAREAEEIAKNIRRKLLMLRIGKIPGT